MGSNVKFAKMRLTVYLGEKTGYTLAFPTLFEGGSICGGVAEWLKALAWKAGKRIKLFREFESHPLRHFSFW